MMDDLAYIKTFRMVASAIPFLGAVVWVGIMLVAQVDVIVRQDRPVSGVLAGPWILCLLAGIMYPANKTYLTTLLGVAALAAVTDLLLPGGYEYFHNRRRRLEESKKGPPGE